MAEQIVQRGVHDPRVLAAMRVIPRHLFIPEKERKHAYSNRPILLGFGQTISQPFIVALMTEALALTGPEKVLEIGTGVGYQTAILYLLSLKVSSAMTVDPVVTTPDTPSGRGSQDSPNLPFRFTPGGGQGKVRRTHFCDRCPGGLY